MDIKTSRAMHPRQGVYRSPRLKVDARDVQMRSKPTTVHSVFVPRSVMQSSTPSDKPVPLVPAPVHQPVVAPVQPKQVAHVATPMVAEQSTEPIVPEEQYSTETTSVQVVKANQRKFKLTRKKTENNHSSTSSKGKKRRDVRILYTAAACVLLVGGSLAYYAYSLNKAVETQVKKMQDTTSSTTNEQNASLPTDTKPADKNYVQNYRVSPTLPQTLTIKKIGIAARILQVGIDKDGRMDVPKTAYDVAWYNGSSRPGEAGAMVIDGHVQGVGGGAIFTNLKKLVAGDEIKVTRGDGKVYLYSVTKAETIPVGEVDMNKLLVSADTNMPGLNLITCGGSYDTQSNTFNSRTIVYALQQ